MTTYFRVEYTRKDEKSFALVIPEECLESTMISMNAGIQNGQLIYAGYSKVVALKAICDTWNMIDKYNLKGWIQDGTIVYLPEHEYECLYNAAVNKKYIENLVRG